MDRRTNPVSAAPPPSVSWDPAAYAANSASQQAWARELIARLALRGDEHVLDVGCGDGKVTAELAAGLTRGSITGVDASSEMIRFAREQFPRDQFPNVDFQVMDARELRFNRRFDIVFSNAALHWVDDHQAFLRGAAAALRPGGRLRTSCGGRGNGHDVYVAVRAEMRLKRWRAFFRKLEQPYFFYSPDDYRKWLPRFGFEIGRVALVPKDMVLRGGDGLAAWLRTTWLPYTQRVPEPAREQFIAGAVERYVAKHPRDNDGNVHVKMVRLEIEATKELE